MITKNRYCIVVNKQSLHATKVHNGEILIQLFKKHFTTIADNPEIINRYFCL